MLVRHGVQFVIVGGQAAVLHGSPVVTWDFDACYERGERNLSRLVAALKDLQARLRVADMRDEETEDLPFSLDVPSLEAGMNFTFQTRAGAVDLLGQPAGVLGYDELAANAIEVQLFGVSVKVCGLEDLMTMKRHAGRPKDFAQLAELTALRDELERRGLLATMRPPRVRPRKVATVWRVGR